MLRQHGDLVRQDRPAITAERLETMLFSIMTPKELSEFRETGDTDWAYEVEGVARFRCMPAVTGTAPLPCFASSRPPFAPPMKWG